VLDPKDVTGLRVKLSPIASILVTSDLDLININLKLKKKKTIIVENEFPIINKQKNK
jgi:predicted nucleic acid-binding protein